MANIGLGLQSTSTVEQVPDEILFEIFKYLPTTDLLSASRVCRRWKRVAGDRYLWKHVDLTPFNLPLQQLKTFTKTYLSYTLQSLQLKGYQTAEGNNKSGPSAAFFADLEQRCPNLRSLDLSYVDLRAPLPASVEFLALGESWLSPSGWPASRFDAESQTVTLPRLREVELVGVKLRKGAMAALPSSVERLWILDTRLPQSCFQSDPVNQGVVSPSRLAELDFSYSNSTAPEIRQATTAWPHVTTLKLDECFYIPFTQFVTNLDRLEVLEANELLTSLTDFNVCVICDNLGGTLRRLGIAGSQLSVIGAWLIAEKLTHLESLEVSSCRQLPPVTFFMFANLRGTLRSLNISDTNVDSGTVDVLKSCMPACNIVN